MSKRNYANGIPIVVIGGGTGLSTMLRGLKKHTRNITAIVTVADDGGGSGALRQDLGMLPPGDIRNCILALSETEPLMARLLSYRFTDGQLTGQSFGNLFLAAMNGISDNFMQAVERVSDVLKVTGKVVPVTLDDVHLNAQFNDGASIRGESHIAEYSKRQNATITNIALDPSNPTPLAAALEAIESAALIILGPGSLYTSVIANLLVPGIAQSVVASKAHCVYVCNIMTQPGETLHMSALAHANAINRYAGANIINTIILNSQEPPSRLTDKYYIEEGSQLVDCNFSDFGATGISVLTENLVDVSAGYIRHNPERLARTIFSLI